ncbi:NADH-quinone oxidoreductase subunit L [Phytohabitans sp. ZYX-F-186]|uniref:NADH-quinone oxidoreductase subunit L n=1 Tax=Phytohabitans maris TaxID=3071409 RepID=A0ABU0Z8N3_9ACTN|nr:NADH-quinone oxidoreductase subunit L [Phytohabitans sp. ZYX-F-186]MDQ7903421.1 NADH-quinone oxidoreductase subunit L [Phytohabitans sp. ZYX-F-186]
MIPGVLLPAVPFAAALVGLLLPLRARRAAATVAVIGAGGALAIAPFLNKSDESQRWLDIGDLTVTFGARVDQPAILVAVAVGVVALAVQVYSIAYLAGDDRYPPYAAQVSLFTAAMLLVVVAGDLIMLLVGWEVMGICSYLLIGHDRRLPEAPAAAVKAFIVTRVGDVGFLLGIAVLGIGAGTFRIAGVLAHDYSATTLTVAGLLLLAGVAGKSAQFPLHTWLPDAMAGPTPISALIHAATMVAAGIYVVTRLYPLFTGTALAVLGVMAAITLLLGALAATAQDDIKRVLAWSTVSQIGYMAGALAVGSTSAALFHLLTHAAFKALLFLAAGCVIHAVGSTLMSRMGGLRRDMPVTFWSFAIGLGALAGLPPLAGFWSKESIVVAAHHPHGPAPEWVGWLVWLAALAGIAITALYAARLLRGVFFGPANAHGHEAPPLMRWPIALLAVPSALLGLAVFWPAFREAIGLEEASIDAWALLPVALLAAGAVVGWRGVPTVPAFARAFWLDEVQHLLLVRPVRSLAHGIRLADEAGVDGAVEGTGRLAVGLGRRLATAHRSGLPRAATAVLAAAVLLAALGVIL